MNRVSRPCILQCFLFLCITTTAVIWGFPPVTLLGMTQSRGGHFEFWSASGNDTPSNPTTSPKCVDCVIVGAGPAGLATSIAISKAVPLASIAIMERDHFQPKGASIQISKPGWESIRNLDAMLLQYLKATSVPVTDVEFKAWRKTERGIIGTVKQRVEGLILKIISWFFRKISRRGAITYTHLWHDVRTVLAQRAMDLYQESGTTPLLHLNCSLDSIRILPESNNETAARFELVFRWDENAKNLYSHYVIQTRFLFACDGTKSQVRSLLPKEPDILVSEQKSVWRGVAPNIDCHGKATFYRDTDRSGLVFPAGKEAGSSWTVISPITQDGSKSQSDAQARERVLQVIQDCQDDNLFRAIHDSPIVIEHKLHVRNFDLPWESAYDGLIYLGDSAHPVRPTGEGTALAFEDAKVLCQCLTRYGLTVSALREYESKRYEPVKRISRKARANAEAFYSKPPRKSIPKLTEDSK